MIQSALLKAIKAIQGMTKDKITEISTFKKPPQKVEMVAEALCLLFGVERNWKNA